MGVVVAGLMRSADALRWRVAAKRRGIPMITTLIVAVAVCQPCPDGVCRPQFVPRTPRTAETPHPAVVRIANENGRVRVFGSGTLVAADQTRGLVVSCAHLFREFTGKICVTFASGEAFEARLLDVDEHHDLSALEISLPSARPVKVAVNAPRVGDPLVSCGYGPHGQYATNMGHG